MSEARAVSPLSADWKCQRERVMILGVWFDRMTRAAALARMEESFGRGEAWKVFIANAHTLNLGCADPGFQRVLNEATLLLNDGTGVQIASRLAGRAFHDNLVGTDLIPQICERASRKGTGVFLLGGKEGVAERAGQRLQHLIPGLRISGAHQGFISASDMPGVVKSINRSRAGILLVAFGNPLQETWIHQYSTQLKCDLCIGVGGLFDHLSGRLRRAPLWMRLLGIEWVHILARQPYKWRRYLIGSPLFLARLIAERARSI